MTVSTSARRWLAACSLGALAALAPDAAAAADAGPAVDKSAWESGWHVVRPGDTLEGLAERYLGSSALWRELHVLNPFVKDPDLLFPGQRLHIFLERPTAKLSAQVMAIARDVRELPTPVPWRSASEGDVLLERDALRTASAASARLRFDDGATVTLSEDSLVFIRHQTQATSPLPKKEIEIQLGQADIAGPASGSASGSLGGAVGAKPASGGNRSGGAGGAIEVVVGGARSLAAPDGDQPLATRSRKGSGDSAQFMVFAGKSTVSAAGASVEVPAGNGTSVAAKAAPGPVEALLPAPAELRPAADEELARSAPELAWSAVAGAAHYTVELCRDPACGALVERAPNVAASPHRLAAVNGLPDGTFFWRVTAVAPSGLDGFPSPPMRVSLVENSRPPSPVVSLRDAAGTALAPGGCFGSAPEIVVRADDRRGDALPWALLVDGSATTREEMSARPLAGRHEIVARVTDGRGRSADSPAVAFTVDAAAPWIDLLADGASPVVEDEPPPKHHWLRRTREPVITPSCDSGLEVLDANGLASPVPCATTGAVEATVVRIDAARPGVSLRTTGDALTLGGMPAAAQETLELRAWDVGCGVTSLGLRIVPSPYRAGRMMLEAEVSDGAGNRRTQSWHVMRR